MTDSPITWRHTWPERGPDFVAVVAGGSFGRIYKTYPDRLQGYEWVWSLIYPAVTGLPKQGRARTKQDAVDAVHAGLNDALRWHAERGEPLLLRRFRTGEERLAGPQPPSDREPLRLVVGQDVPRPDGWS